MSDCGASTRKGGMMLDNFKEIYDSEIERNCEEDSLGQIILNTPEIRVFVYEVCKRCVEEEYKRPDPCCYNKICPEYDETREYHCKLKYPEAREACFGLWGRRKKMQNIPIEGEHCRKCPCLNGLSSTCGKYRDVTIEHSPDCCFWYRCSQCLTDKPQILTEKERDWLKRQAVIEWRLNHYEPKLTSEEEAEFDRMAAIDKHMKKKRFILGGPIDEPKPR